MKTIYENPRLMKKLDTMKKTLDKNPIRNYAGVIGILDGFACATDAYGMLFYYNDAFKGMTGILNGHNVKYPNVLGILPKDTEKLFDVDVTSIINLCKSLKKNPKNLFLIPAKHTSYIKFSYNINTLTEKHLFNPAIIAKFLQGVELPESYNITATLYKNTMLIITFKDNDEKEVYKLITVGLRKE